MLFEFFLVYCYVKTVKILEQTYETCLDCSIYRSLFNLSYLFVISSSGKGFDIVPRLGTAPVSRNANLN